MSNRRKRHKHIHTGRGTVTACGLPIGLGQPPVTVKEPPLISYAEMATRRARLGWCRACWALAEGEQSAYEQQQREDHDDNASHASWLEW